MSERYIRLFSLGENLYTDNSPLVIRAGALLKDTQTGRVISQFKLQNLTDRLVTYVKLCITQLDPANTPIGEPVYFEYMDLNISQGETFGSKVAITLPNASTRSFLVGVVKVSFSGGEPWSSDDTNWKRLSADSHVLQIIKSEDDYKSALELSNKKTKEDVLKAIEAFEALKHIKNVDREIAYCEERLAEFERLDKEKQEKEQAKKQNKRSSLSLIPAILFVAVAIIDLFIFRGPVHGDMGTILCCAYLIVGLACVGYFIWSGLKMLKNKTKSFRFLFWGAIVTLITVAMFFIFPENNWADSLADAFTPIESHLIVLANTILLLSALFLIYTIFKHKIIKGIILLSGVLCILGVVLSFYVFPFGYSQCTDGTYALTSIRIAPISGDVVVPETHNNKRVTRIGDSAFRSTIIKTVTIPDSVTHIDQGAFEYCGRFLTSVKIGDSVTIIGDSAFENCYSLTRVTIGNSVTSIGEKAFAGCESLTSITIPDSVTSIGKQAFVACYALKSVTIGYGVTSIGNEAFVLCNNLTSIKLKNPNGWYSSYSSSRINGERIAGSFLESPSKTAECFKTYKFLYRQAIK